MFPRAQGKSFTVGLDLMDAGGLLAGIGADDREILRRQIVELQESTNAVERCRKPVIAAVHGHCIGAGTLHPCHRGAEALRRMQRWT